MLLETKEEVLGEKMYLRPLRLAVGSRPEYGHIR